VGEREIQVPTLGSRVKDGKRGLHVMIVRGRSRARTLAIALAAVARGVDAVAKTPELDAYLVDRFRISVRRPTRVALDGELESMQTTLEYELRRDALHVVCPPAGPEAKEEAEKGDEEKGDEVRSA